MLKVLSDLFKKLLCLILSFTLALSLFFFFTSETVGLVLAMYTICFYMISQSTNALVSSMTNHKNLQLDKFCFWWCMPISFLSSLTFVDSQFWSFYSYMKLLAEQLKNLNSTYCVCVFMKRSGRMKAGNASKYQFIFDLSAVWV